MFIKRGKLLLLTIIWVSHNHQAILAY